MIPRSQQSYQALELDGANEDLERESNRWISTLRAPTDGKQTIYSLLSLNGLIVGTSLVAGIFALIACYSYYFSHGSSCLGAPYLYVTYSNEHNVMQITRDGCYTMSRALYDMPQRKLHMRSMAMGSYKNKEALYVADASPKTSQIMVFGECSFWNGMRTREASAFGKETVFADGAVHSYGVTFDSDGNLYASYQHTNVVLRAKAATFERMDLPKHFEFYGLQGEEYKNGTESSISDGDNNIISIASSNSDTTSDDMHRDSDGKITPFSGTFFQFGYPNIHDEDDQGIRSIQWATNKKHKELLWITNEFKNLIVMVDRDSKVVHKIDIQGPIGLYHNATATNSFVKDRIFVGSRPLSKKETGSVIAYDVNTFVELGRYTMIGMSHPTGIVVSGGLLYVADQTLKGILTFDLETGRFVKTIWSRLTGGDIEQLILTDC